MLAWRFIYIWFSPWVQRHILRKIGAIPLFHTIRFHPERLESLLRCWIFAYVEPVRIKARFK